jgi:hypothetical protein
MQFVCIQFNFFYICFIQSFKNFPLCIYMFCVLLSLCPKVLRAVIYYSSGFKYILEHPIVNRTFMFYPKFIDLLT